MSIIRSAFFIPAVLLLGLAVGFTIDGDGARWFWSDRPWVAVLLLIGSGVMWTLLLTRRRRQPGS